jgi:hypothetical protein
MVGGWTTCVDVVSRSLPKKLGLELNKGENTRLEALAGR